MKIKENKTQTTMYGTAQVYENRANATEAEKKINFSVKGDWVELSGHGKMVSDTQRAVALIPDVRMPLVTRIRNDLETGAYVFDSVKSADNMIHESFENQAALLLS